jgi:zinc-ribbon domain
LPGAWPRAPTVNGVDSTSGPLACPKCAERYSLDERFCTNCGMPLVYSGRGDENPVTEQHERARKIKAQYTHGDLRRVVTARQQAEAEFIQLLLLEEGIPSTLRRATWDVPEFLAAGPRDVLVPESGLEVARDVLRQSDITPELEAAQRAGAGGGPSPAMLLAGIVVALAIIALLLVIGGR